jgi:hypothetical protein
LPTIINLKVSSPHEAGAYPIAAGQVLHAGLGPSPSFLGLGRRHEAGAAQHGDVGRATLANRHGQRVHCGDRRVVAQDRRHGVQEDGLAVLAGAIDEDQGVFLRRSVRQ